MNNQKKHLLAGFLAVSLVCTGLPSAWTESSEPMQEEALSVVTVSHPAYFFPDSDGLYLPDAYMTRLDLARMIYALSGEPNLGRISYQDISAKSADAPAIKLLKELGIVKSRVFQPDRTITRGELAAALQTAFPALSADEVYHELVRQRDGQITKVDAAVFVNRCFDRVADRDAVDLLYSFMPDISREAEYYYDFAEAVLSHTVEADSAAEIWLEKDSYPVLEPGFVCLNQRLHYVSEDGHFGCDQQIGTFAFDSYGNYTSGSKELDALVKQIVSETVSPKMTELEALHAVYRYVIEHGGYRKGNIYEMGATGWNAEEAYKLLADGRGNCYSFAAAFCELARGLGFAAETVSGLVVGGDDGMTPHGWVELTYEGIDYVCDPEIEYVGGENLFMMEIGTPNCERWKYTRAQPAVHTENDSKEEKIK